MRINNLPPGTTPPFDTVKVLTRIPGRTPEWKAHVSMARAKSAVAQRGGGLFGEPEVWEATPNATWHRVI